MGLGMGLAHDVLALLQGTVAIAPQYAAIAVSASGDTTIAAGVAGQRIVLLAYNFMANGTVNVKWKSGAGTDKSGLSYLVVNTGKVIPFSPLGWLVTNAGDPLVLNLSGNVAVGGECVFAVVT